MAASILAVKDQIVKLYFPVKCIKITVNQTTLDPARATPKFD